LRYCAQRQAVIARSGVISGTGLRRVAARFRALVRTTPRSYCVARRDYGRQCAPRCAAIARCDSILGAGSRRDAWLSRGAARLREWAHAAPRNHRAAWRDFGRGFALPCAVKARLNAIPAYISVYLCIHFILHYTPTYSCTF